MSLLESLRPGGHLDEALAALGLVEQLQVAVDVPHQRLVVVGEPHAGVAVGADHPEVAVVAGEPVPAGVWGGTGGGETQTNPLANTRATLGRCAVGG